MKGAKRCSTSGTCKGSTTDVGMLELTPLPDRLVPDRLGLLNLVVVTTYGEDVNVFIIELIHHAVFLA